MNSRFAGASRRESRGDLQCCYYLSFFCWCSAEAAVTTVIPVGAQAAAWVSSAPSFSSPSFCISPASCVDRVAIGEPPIAEPFATKLRRALRHLGSEAGAFSNALGG